MIACTDLTVICLLCRVNNSSAVVRQRKNIEGLRISGDPRGMSVAVMDKDSLQYKTARSGSNSVYELTILEEMDFFRRFL